MRNFMQAVAGHMVHGGITTTTISSRNPPAATTIGGQQGGSASVDSGSANAGQSTQARYNIDVNIHNIVIICISTKIKCYKCSIKKKKKFYNLFLLNFSVNSLLCFYIMLNIHTSILHFSVIYSNNSIQE